MVKPSVDFGNTVIGTHEAICDASVPKFQVHGPTEILPDSFSASELERFLSELARLVLTAKDLREQMERLSQNMTNAKPVWETRGGDEKYLRLVYPTKNGSRHREYIGNKPSKVQAALQRVENYKTYYLLKKELAQVERKIAWVMHHWRNTMAALD